VVTLPLTALAVVTGGIGAWATLTAASRGSTTVRAVVQGLRMTGLALLASSVGVVALAAFGPLRTFGVIHHAYLAVTVSLPMVGAAGLASSLWRITTRTAAERAGSSPGPGSKAAAAALVSVLLVPAPFGFYATHVEPRWLRVDHVDVVLEPERAGDDLVTIGVLSDLQTNRVGAHERKAVDALVDAEPDLIVIPGDLFHGTDAEHERELSAMRDLLGRLRARHGVYMVQGDADPVDWTKRFLEGTEVRVLDRDVVDLEVGDRRVRLGGHTLHPSAHDADVVRRELDSTADDGAITVLLAHRPDTVLYLPERSRVDLTIAGHTHGGQVVVPGIGPLITLSDVPRTVARGGLHRVDGNQIYVSPGVGIERGDAPQIRLFNRPAVAILTLR
jgi:predicted MPP superfamily phosphohydrolase